MTQEMMNKVVTNKNEKIIKLAPSEVKNFVKMASKCDFDIDVSYDHVYVDGKSILGILGLDLSRNLTISYYGTNEEFSAYLDSLAV